MRASSRVDRAFDAAPEPRAAFEFAAFGSAYVSLMRAIQDRAGLILLVGPAGSGKSTLLRTIRNVLTRKQTTVLSRSRPGSGLDDLLASLLDELRITSVSASREDRLEALAAFLDRRKEPAVLLVDEAHHAPDRALVGLAALAMYRRGENDGLQVVLAGDTQLEDRLQCAELAWIADHIADTVRLDPLAPDEVGDYIAHRIASVRRSLRLARGTGNPFAPEAIRQVLRYSNGVPGTVNRLCRTASSGRPVRIDVARIDRAAFECGLAPPPAPDPSADTRPASAGTTPAGPQRHVAPAGRSRKRTTWSARAGYGIAAFVVFAAVAAAFVYQDRSGRELVLQLGPIARVSLSPERGVFRASDVQLPWARSESSQTHDAMPDAAALDPDMPVEHPAAERAEGDAAIIRAERDAHADPPPAETPAVSAVGDPDPVGPVPHAQPQPAPFHDARVPTLDRSAGQDGASGAESLAPADDRVADATDAASSHAGSSEHPGSALREEAAPPRAETRPIIDALVVPAMTQVRESTDGRPAEDEMQERAPAAETEAAGDPTVRAPQPTGTGPGDDLTEPGEAVPSTRMHADIDEAGERDPEPPSAIVPEASAAPEIPAAAVESERAASAPAAPAAIAPFPMPESQLEAAGGSEQPALDEPPSGNTAAADVPAPSPEPQHSNVVTAESGTSNPGGTPAETQPPTPVPAPPAITVQLPAQAAGTGTSLSPPPEASRQPAVDPPPKKRALASERLMARGDAMLRSGDPVGARLFFERAAAQGHAGAMAAVGRTFDPIELRRLGLPGVSGQPRRAVEWYRRAIEAGEQTSREQLAALEEWMQRQQPRR